MSFTPVAKELLFSKNDSQDSRLGEFVNTSSTACLTVLGYPDDEGIQNNGGRKGASQGPDTIRKYLYRMTLPMLRPSPIQLNDIGNLIISPKLEERHKVAQSKLEILFKTSNVISFGGGHDYAYPDGAAFLKTFSQEKYKPLIINFDAHLDVRPLKDNITSGTPFYRLLENFQNFDLLEIGIQSQCNSSFHYDWALKKGAQVLTYDELVMSGETFTKKMLEFLEPHILKKRPAYISIDMDCLSSAFAPGCSQVFATGLTPFDLLPVLKILLKRLDVKILGIYETSPALDIDDRTSKLAAQLAYEYVFAF
jgi:formiminoglutamase